MKKTHILTISAILILLIIMSACGRKKDSSNNDSLQTSIITVCPASVMITGSLGEFFEVADHDYVIIDGLLTIEVKRNMKDYSFPAAKLCPYGESVKGNSGFYGFGIELYGTAGTTEKKDASATGVNGPFNYRDAAGLFNLKKGATGFIRWKINNVEAMKTFRLTSALRLP
jgi:hypothetical protein